VKTNNEYSKALESVYGGWFMQSYIVRVYHRNPDNMDDVAGTVEKVGAKQKNTFHDLTDLQEYLEYSIKSDESEYPNYSKAKQLDLYELN
jgi:hypothetical protein